MQVQYLKTHLSKHELSYLVQQNVWHTRFWSSQRTYTTHDATAI